MKIITIYFFYKRYKIELYKYHYMTTNITNEINEQFLTVMSQNEIFDIKRFVVDNNENNNFNINYKNDEGIKIAAKNGNTTVIDFLLFDPILKKHSDLHTSNGQILHDACASGSLELVKFLLESPKIKNKIPIESCDNNALIEAAMNNHIDIVLYLLLSPKLKKHADIHVKNDYILSTACYEGYEEMIKVLLLNTSLKDKININNDKEQLLRSAILGWNTDIIQFLIGNKDLDKHANLYYEDGIILTELISECEEEDLEDMLIHKLNFLLSYLTYEQLISLCNNSIISSRNHILSMIKNIILYYDLQKDLKKNDINNKRSKV